ncbi:hypothetical protein VCHA50P416_310037 [Vibrio chagasii]|nr:hypothetical protein VCHA36P166_320039 [Vibrio chagasii]CAH6965847.1 hypothetical protein VCHA41O246_130157 [Vibrio chagasii]CAH7173327.1 hypothetical protein VCHA42P256_300021 [Vibrio chagasii]CAH7208584.1 hypothetical protein VCHA43P272_320033 [Vibrio chagasii]CAH7398149.1 hypothetical protein VCHA50P416_310037 [Vibrio chagasii]
MLAHPRVKHSALSQFLDMKDEVNLSLIMKFPKADFVINGLLVLLVVILFFMWNSSD